MKRIFHATGFEEMNEALINNLRRQNSINEKTIIHI